MKIPLQYKIPLVGEYNSLISTCYFCGKNIEDFEEGTYVCDYALGIADSQYGEMIVIECPYCFEKFYFHTRNSKEESGFASTFLRSVHFGRNKHFKNTIK